MNIYIMVKISQINLINEMNYKCNNDYPENIQFTDELHDILMSANLDEFDDDDKLCIMNILKTKLKQDTIKFFKKIGETALYNKYKDLLFKNPDEENEGDEEEKEI